MVKGEGSYAARGWRAHGFPAIFLLCQLVCRVMSVSPTKKINRNMNSRRGTCWARGKSQSELGNDKAARNVLGQGKSPSGLGNNKAA